MMDLLMIGLLPHCVQTKRTQMFFLRREEIKADFTIARAVEPGM